MPDEIVNPHNNEIEQHAANALDRVGNREIVELTQEELILQKMLEMSESEVLQDEYERSSLRENEDGTQSYIGDEALFHQREGNEQVLNWEAPRIGHRENIAIGQQNQGNMRLGGPEQQNDVAIFHPGQNIEQRVEAPLAIKNVGWSKIEDLAGYVGGGRNPAGRIQGGRMGGGRDFMGEAVRTLGRAIFGSMDCFKDMERECRQKGLDPLGQINVVAYNDFTHGPNSFDEVNTVMGWIRENGTGLEAKTIELPGIMANYRPNLILAITNDSAFLLVQDSIRQGGVSVNGSYVYSWKLAPGYVYNGDGFRDVERNNILAGRRAALPNETVINNRANIPEERIEYQERKKTRPVQKQTIETNFSKATETVKPVVQNSIKMLRISGFKTKATESGPILVKELEDGNVVEVSGHNNSLTMATEFNVILKNGSNNISSEIMKGDEILDWVQNQVSRKFGM